MVRPSLHAALALVLMATVTAAQTAPLAAARHLTSGRALAEALGVGAFTHQTLDLPSETGSGLAVQVVLGGQSVTLALRPHSLRSGEQFQVLAQIEDGSYVEVAPAPLQTWRGEVLGVAGSRVAASLAADGLSAVVLLPDGLDTWGIQPASQVDPGAAPGEHLVFSVADTLQRGQSCAGALLVGDPAPPPAGGGAAGGALDLGDTLCQIACDADVEFYNSNGASVVDTQLDIEKVLNTVETIYEVSNDITYEITTILVRTSQPDPYTSSNAGTLLSQFRNEWNNNQGSIPRDVAHLFTGRDLDGGTIGVAYLGVICSGSQAYGLSQSKFAGSLPSRAALTAHELGHNWSAQHCDSLSDCRIMCSGLGGCGGQITSFAPASINSIDNEKNSSGCLSVAGPSPAPSLTAVVPSTVGALGGQSLTLEGDDFFEATQVQIGGTTLLQGQFTVSNDGRIVVTAPVPVALGDVDVVVSGPGGSSATVSYTVVAEDPPQLVVPPGIVVGGGGTVTFTYAGTPGATVYFLFNINASGVFTYKGFPVLNSPFDPLVLSAGPTGVGQLVVPVTPALSLGGLYSLFTQAAFFAPQIQGVTPVKNTLVL